MICGNLKPFVDEILDYHKCKALRSFRGYNEGAFHTGIEVLLKSLSISFISELQLISKYKAKLFQNKSKISYGFPDIFVSDNDGFNSVVIELKLCNLIGLYSGEMNEWVRHPEHNSLIELDERIQEESEEKLLNRNYIYWCNDEHKYKSIKVNTLIENGYEQLCNYIKIIGCGKANNSVGIADNRASVKPGIGLLNGYLVVSFGRQRVIVRSKFKTVNYQILKIL